MGRVVVVAGLAGRTGLVHLLEGGGFDVVAGVDPGPDVVGVVDRVQPDLVLLELGNLGDAQQLVAGVGRRRPPVPVVVLADVTDGACVASMVGAGGRGFLLRATPVESLLRALRAVIAGGVVIDPSVASHVVDVVTRGARAPGAHGLSRAEERVLVQLPGQLTDREIGDRVGISRSTVKTHLRSVYRKLGVRDRGEAARFAIEHGLT